jgi:hypothetical protein
LKLGHGPISDSGFRQDEPDKAGSSHEADENGLDWQRMKMTDGNGFKAMPAQMVCAPTHPPSRPSKTFLLPPILFHPVHPVHPVKNFNYKHFVRPPSTGRFTPLT